MSTPADRIQEHAEEYRREADDDRPLGAYSVLLAAYLGVVATLAFLGRRRLPERLAPADLALGAVATFIATRTIAKDAITSPLRMAFTRYEGVSGPAELQEEVRGTGWRHAVGELLTCPFCLSQWTATTLVAGLVVAPRLTRAFMAIFAMVGVSDFLQLAYARAQQAADG
jgi:hypothetical protein